MEGGEIASGNSVVAIFEIATTVSDSMKLAEKNEALAQVSIGYNLPGDKVRKEIKYDCAANLAAFKSIDKEFQFAHLRRGRWPGRLYR